MMVRRSTNLDIEQITAIYRHYVLQSTATFETEPPDEVEMARRRDAVVARELPFYVADSGNGRILGFAYAGPYRPRGAYRFTVEDSLYVHPEATGQGCGRALLEVVIGQCARLGYRQMIAVIGGSDNAASIGLHRALGFRHAGLLRDAGFKFERWLDSVLMQRSL